MELPMYVNACLMRLEEAGFACYAVGGCVRDAVLGLMPHDYDLCTSATPQQMKDLFSDHSLVCAGEKHGTIGVITENGVVEITTFRTEGAYADNRHPSWVEFVKDIEADLARRDFTVNAMAYHPRRGLCDPFDGKGDLERRIIRAVGEPSRRFDEDALRILRALRFAVRLDFSIEEQTAQAMCEAAPTLALIARERITEELRGILGSVGCAAVWPKFMPVWRQVLPGVKEIEPSIWGAPLDFVLRLVLLCYRSGSDVTERLCLTKIERRALNRLLAAIDQPIPTDVIAVRRLAAAHGLEDADALLRLWQALGRDTEAAGSLLCECVERGDCMSVAQLAITGADLDVPPAQIGQALRGALDAVVSERVPNERTALISYMKHGKMKYMQKRGGC